MSSDDYSKAQVVQLILEQKMPFSPDGGLPSADAAEASEKFADTFHHNYEFDLSGTATIGRGGAAGKKAKAMLNKRKDARSRQWTSELGNSALAAKVGDETGWKFQYIKKVNETGMPGQKYLVINDGDTIVCVAKREFRLKVAHDPPMSDPGWCDPVPSGYIYLHKKYTGKGLRMFGISTPRQNLKALL